MSEHEHDFITTDRNIYSYAHCKCGASTRLSIPQLWKNHFNYKQALEEILDTMPPKLSLPLTKQIRDIAKEALKESE